MKKVLIWVSALFLGVLSVFIFRQASSRTREIKRDMTQFFKLIEARRYQEAYEQWTTPSYHKTRSLARFTEEIGVLGGAHKLVARELFISFRRSTLRGEVKKQQGRLYTISFHLRKRQGRQKVYAFHIRESVAGVSTAFLQHIRKKRWGQAYDLTSQSFRKHVSRNKFPTWSEQQGILRWHSFQWTAVDNYSKRGQVSGVWRSRKVSMGHLSVWMEREQGRHMIASVDVGKKQ